MASMPSPVNVAPAPRRSFSTSLTNERSAMGRLLHHLERPAFKLDRRAALSLCLSIGFIRKPLRSFRFDALDIVPADVPQHLVERGDQRRILGIVHALEHRLEFVMHERPGAPEFGAPL